MEIMNNVLTDTAANAVSAPAIEFVPTNFLENLQRMGIGMLVIFVIIGIIILTTLMINKIFSD